MSLISTPTAATLVAVAAVEAAPAATHHASTACLNCDALLTDKFCASCGQPAGTHRLTMGHLLHEIPHSIWHVDKGLLYTLRELLLRPGPMLRSYLHGQRVRYFAPLSLLLLVTGVASFLAIKLRLGAMAQAGADYSAEMREAQAQGAESVMHYMSWLYVAMSPLIGWFARRALGRAGLNLAEAIVVVLYVTAATNLLSLLVLPFYHWVSTQSGYFQVSTCSTLLIMLYQTWAFSQLLVGTTLGTFGRWWRGLLTAVSAYLLVVCGGIILMFTLNWSGLKSALRHELQHQRAMHASPPAR